MKYSLKISKDYAKTKFIILNAGFDLFNRYGYADVTIADICKHAKVSRSAFRGYYEKKSELMNDLATIVLEEINDVIRSVTLNEKLDFREKIISVFNLGLEYKKHFSLIQQANLISKNNNYLQDFSCFLDESKAEFFNFLQVNIETSVQINPLLKRYDAKDVAILLFGYFEAIYYDTMPSIVKQSKESIFNNLHIFVNP